MDNINLNNIKGKKVLVVGMGRSGIAALQAMLKLGADVTVQDAKKADEMDGQLLSFLTGKGLKLCLGSVPDDICDFDMMILSPGVDPELDFICRAREAGVEITGELEIAYRICRGRFVAITGTNGKTTTTALTGEIFKRSGRSTYVVGNIGVAVISKALDTQEDDWLVTETSSFQLETTRYFKPVVSAILNITPDHMNRHHTMDNYSMAKAKIFANQDESGYCIINGDDEICCRLAENCRAKVTMFSLEKELQDGAFLKDGTLVIADGGQVTELCRRDELKIIGRHNIQNALAAAAISFYAGIPAPVIREGLINFGGVEHRIEYCGSVDGVKYYNDSKATNVDAAVTAIEAIGKDIILIAGGDGKGQDFTDLIKNFRGRVKHLILLGRDGPLIGAAADKEGYGDHESCPNMEECVKRAAQMADSGDTVLLSPACASWDMYDNFEQRGRHFKEIVARLSK